MLQERLVSLGLRELETIARIGLFRASSRFKGMREMPLLRRHKQWTLNIDTADNGSQTYRVETDIGSHSEGLEPTLSNTPCMSVINGNCSQMRTNESLTIVIMAHSREFNVTSQ
jgi:hypothetical protein